MNMHGKTKEDLEARASVIEALLTDTLIVENDEDDALFTELQQINFTLGEIDAGRPTPLH